MVERNAAEGAQPLLREEKLRGNPASGFLLRALCCFSYSLGIPHDGEGNRCSSSGYIMGSAGNHNSIDLAWSQCSREEFLAFVR